MGVSNICSLAVILIQLLLTESISAFAPTIVTSPLKTCNNRRHFNILLGPLASSPENNNDLGVIDLTDDDDEDDAPAATASEASKEWNAPFLSQGELSDDPNLLSPDFQDVKQTRVIIYIILTLVPILFLVPLMIGSRDLIPLDALPPVDIN